MGSTRRQRSLTISNRIAVTASCFGTGVIGVAYASRATTRRPAARTAHRPTLIKIKIMSRIALLPNGANFERNMGKLSPRGHIILKNGLTQTAAPLFVNFRKIEGAGYRRREENLAET